MEDNVRLLAIGQRIRSIRKNRKLTQGDLAKIADMKASNISEIENGKSQMHLLTFIKIIEALQVSADEILLPDVTSVRARFDADYLEVLKDCTAAEMDMIIKFARELRENMRL